MNNRTQQIIFPLLTFFQLIKRHFITENVFLVHSFDGFEKGNLFDRRKEKDM